MTINIDFEKIRFSKYEKPLEIYRPDKIITLEKLIDKIVTDFLKSEEKYLIIPKRKLHRNLTADRCRAAIQKNFAFTEVFVDKKNVLVVKTILDIDESFSSDVIAIINNAKKL